MCKWKKYATYTLLFNTSVIEVESKCKYEILKSNIKVILSKTSYSQLNGSDLRIYWFQKGDAYRSMTFCLAGKGKSYLKCPQ